MSRSENPNRVLIIGGYRVAFVRGVGWKCNCESWNSEKGCAHCMYAAAWTALDGVVTPKGGSTTRH